MANIIPIDPSINALKSPIVLLKAVRDVMTASSSHGKSGTQKRLDALVETIATAMHADVCSIYLARPGDILELFASHGLKKSSIHVTRLRVGEGLVGEIAETANDLNLTEPQTHPKFAYRPETGEEEYHSFIGVPLLHSHKVIGVLVVQSKQSRNYTPDLLEILHTVAMVIAELVIGTKLVDAFDIAGAEHPALQSQQFSGLTLAPGIAKAPIVLHRPKIEIAELVAESPEHEEARFKDALVSLQNSVDAMISAAGLQEGTAQHDILESYRLFSQDRGWIERIIEAIQSGLSAEAAVRKVQEEMHARLSKISSAYIQERVHDLEDLSERLLYHLAGIEPTAAHGELPDGFILLAKNLGPAELLEYDPEKLKGIVLEEGSSTAHVTIIARMMDVPIVGRVPHISSLVSAGDLAVLQGDHGTVYIRPPDDVVEAVDDAIAAREEQQARYAAMRDLPAVSKDGKEIRLNLNVGLFIDGQQLAAPDIHGVGLFRTELPYLSSRDLPSVDDQTRIYRDAFEKADGKRIIFRSFDIGGDKQVPYINTSAEENPAMGWRATRIGLDRPVILRQQFRAFIRAANGRPLWVMFPFIAEVAEFDACKSIFMKELEKADHEGFKMPSEVKIGSMIEIPSILYQLPELMKRIDFASIGSNDLMQFMFAVDRGSARLSARYDGMNSAVIRMLRTISAAADPEGVEVSFCGDMATRPLEAMVLLGCGLRSLSMPPSAVGAVKTMIRSLDISELQRFLETMHGEASHSVRKQLEAFARDHGVIIE